jgi:hypothetical protein
MTRAQKKGGTSLVSEISISFPVSAFRYVRHVEDLRECWHASVFKEFPEQSTTVLDLLG